MSTPVEQIILDTLRSDCTGSCPYKYGDGDQHRERLAAKLGQKLKHRVADGNEVRVLEKRVQELERVVKDTVMSARSVGVTLRDINQLEHILNKKRDGA